MSGPSRQGFTLIEVLLSVALFAISVVVLAGAYVDIIEGVERVRADRAFEQEMRWVREQVLIETDLKKVEEGGESTTTDFGRARWDVEIEPTEIADLFRVSIHVVMEGTDDVAPREATEQIMLLRPQWSEPVEREKLRTESRSRIEESRRRQGVLTQRESR